MPHRRRPSILIVDDDADIRNVFSKVLSMNGYEVITAEEGRSAIQMIDSGATPSLILLDLMMPTMDGTEFLQKRGNRADLSRIPVILFTASATIPEQEQIEVLKKPMELYELLAMVQKHCPLTEISR